MQHFDPLAFLDWTIIVAFFVVTMGIGLYFSKRGTGSLTEYFVAGRKMTWWLAGTSIVATSFAADTPLVIAGWMRTVGLERNWFWWGGIMGMMLCTFFFARLWRRAGILTDVEFNELRYSGAPAASLRIFHASYRSLIQNTLVMGWVTLAMTKILEVTLNIPTMVFVRGSLFPTLLAKGIDVASTIDPALIAHWPLIGEAVIPAKVTGIVLCMSVAALYSTISGLWGVMATDFFQFCFAMTGTIVLMVIAFLVAKGPTQMVEKARAVVESGQVINRAPLVRRIVPAGEAKALETNPAGGVDLAALAGQGLLEPDPSTGDWRWTADGLTEERVLKRIEKAGANPKPVIALWQKAYTVSPARFSDRHTVRRMIEAGVLADDRTDAGQPLNAYRFTRLDQTDAALEAGLTAAGITDKSEVMAAWRNDQVVSPPRITNFLPPFDLKGGGLLAVWSLIVFLGLQWWAGGEGGGFLAQRLFSCKNEKHSVLAMLWFNLANYVIRPWPWIVVGVASLFLIPDITAYGAGYDAEHAYVVMLMKYMPVGLKGLMVAALMAAYMSTISTHVNFGASYVVNDLYKRFLDRKCPERRAVRVSQIASIVLAILAALYAFYSQTIASGWLLMFELMSGVGFVVLLRWYWWRINAWSELTAMFSSLLMWTLLNKTTVFHALFGWIGAPQYLLDEYAVRFTLNMACTTVLWVAVTFLTPPEKDAHLLSFYRRIRPAGWWRHIEREAGIARHLKVGRLEWLSWFLGVTGLFAMIFCLGKACFGRYLQSAAFGVYGIVATYFIFKLIDRMDWSGMASTETDAD